MKQQFIGTKIVIAEVMNRFAYNQMRGWTVPADENPADEGYLVEYQDGGKPNVPGRAGYVSWSPKEQFENAYRPTSGMPFGLAMEALKQGRAITRAGWNGRGMFAYMVDANAYPATSGIAHAHFGGQLVPYNAYMALVGADGKVSTWAPSGSDALADDWLILELTSAGRLVLGSQVDPIMALPHKRPEVHAADSMDHAQLQALGQKLAAIEKPAADEAPKVSSESIDALVDSLEYLTMRMPGTTSTIAMAQLPNNFVVAIGRSACVSPANFDAQKGADYAIEDARAQAREKLWEFEGYVLAKMLAQAQINQAAPPSQREQSIAQLEQDGRPPHQVRVFIEHWDLLAKINSLQAFRVTPMFTTLDGAEQGRLTRQQSAMQAYADILAERIAAF